MMTVMTKRELLPCPFCGQPLTVRQRKHNPHARCETPDCKGTQLPLLNLDQPDDIARWNTRAAPRQPDGDGLEAVESLHVWRATNRFGDTCHFGDAGCARVWAGAGGKVNRIELKPVPELYDVNYADTQRKPEVDGLEVVAWKSEPYMCGSEHYGKPKLTFEQPYSTDRNVEPLCSMPDAQSAIAELRAECERLRKITSTTMGVGSGAGQLFVNGDYDSIKAAQAIVMERDTLRQQLAERDAAIEEWSGTAVQNGMECDRLAANLDKLAGLLREVRGYYKAMPTGMGGRIDAALAEAKP